MKSQSTESTIVRIWHRLPLLIRAIIIGFVVFEIGVVAWVLIVGPLLPAPWSILVMGLLLWVYLRYFSGNWGPHSSQKNRENNFRAVKLSGSVWKWSLLATVFFVVIIQSGLVVTFRLMEFPADAFTEEYYFDTLPIWLAWLFIIMSSLVAGICEEVGLRGYMQVPLEQCYGPTSAIMIVSLFFLVIHLHQAWATPILFHVITISVLLGVLAYVSGSLIPSMIGHTVMDIFNFSYWWSDVAGKFEHLPIMETGIDTHFIVWTLILVLSMSMFYWTAQKTLLSRKSAANSA
jgi:membrane protease YdiL (CAAX protease family)